MDPLMLMHRSVGQFHITSFAYIQKKEQFLKKPFQNAAHILAAVRMYLCVRWPKSVSCPARLYQIQSGPL